MVRRLGFLLEFKTTVGMNLYEVQRYMIEYLYAHSLVQKVSLITDSNKIVVPRQCSVCGSLKSHQTFNRKYNRYYEQWNFLKNPDGTRSNKRVCRRCYGKLRYEETIERSRELAHSFAIESDLPKQRLLT